MTIQCTAKPPHEHQSNHSVFQPQPYLIEHGLINTLLEKNPFVRILSSGTDPHFTIPNPSTSPSLRRAFPCPAGAASTATISTMARPKSAPCPIKSPSPWTLSKSSSSSPSTRGARSSSSRPIAGYASSAAWPRYYDTDNPGTGYRVPGTGTNSGFREPGRTPGRKRPARGRSFRPQTSFARLGREDPRGLQRPRRPAWPVFYGTGDRGRRGFRVQGIVVFVPLTGTGAERPAGRRPSLLTGRGPRAAGPYKVPFLRR